MKLEEIIWPVFQLKSEQPLSSQGVSGYLKHMLDTEELDIYSNILVIDDKNITGDTLGVRRLKLMLEGVSLYPLTKAIYMLGDLIRLTKGRKSWSIDNSGKVFNYIKTFRAPLSCHKILQVLRVSSGGYILELEGIGERFKILNEVKDCKYAGIITINRRKILYGLYIDKFKKTYRLV